MASYVAIESRCFWFPPDRLPDHLDRGVRKNGLHSVALEFFKDVPIQCVARVREVHGSNPRSSSRGEVSPSKVGEAGNVSNGGRTYTRTDVRTVKRYQGGQARRGGASEGDMVNVEQLYEAVSKACDGAELIAILEPWKKRLSKNQILFMMEKERDWRRVLCLHDWLGGRGWVSSFSYNLLLRSVLRADQREMGEGLVEEMRERGCQPDAFTFSTMISYYGKSGDLNEAMGWFQKMKTENCSPDLVTFSSVIEMLAKNGDYLKSVSTFREMGKAGIKPDGVLFNFMLGIFGKMGATSEAQELLKEMEKEGFTPNSVTYGSLIKAFSVAKKYKEAIQVFERLLENPNLFDILTINIMIDIYGRAEIPRAAEKLFWNLRKWNLKPTVVSFNAMIKTYGENKMRPEALALFERMKEEGVVPNIVTYNTLLKVHANGMEPVKATQLVEHMEQVGVFPNSMTYSSLLSLYGRVGWFRKAEKLFLKVRKEGRVKVDSSLYCTIIGVHKSGGLTSLVKRRQMEVKESTDVTKDETVQVLCKTGQVEEASKFFWKAHYFGFLEKYETYEMVAESEGRRGRGREVLKVGEAMRERGMLPGGRLQGRLMSAHLMEGEREEAVELYEEWRRRGCVIPESVHCKAMKVFGLLGRSQKSESIFRKIKEGGGTPSRDTYFVLMRLRQDEGFLEEATKLFEEMKAIYGTE